MRTFVDPKDYEAVLSQWRGTYAKIWIFHVTFMRMAIMLSRKGEHEALYVTAIGCEYLSGPFSWHNADVSIVTDSPNQWGEIRHHIQDNQVGFDLLCSSVVLFRGPAAVPIDSFENFLEDAE